MKNNVYTFDWSDLAFASKGTLSKLKATFIVAPRELSPARFKEIIKTYLPKGNIILGLAKEQHVLGFEKQPQFRMLRACDVQQTIEKVNNSNCKNRIYTLGYFQRELSYVLDKIDLERVVLINGSWRYTFHTQTPYYTLVNRGIPYEMISPFTNEEEALSYEKKILKEIKPAALKSQLKSNYSESDMFTFAEEVAKHSFDHTFQTGAILGRKTKGYYKFLTAAYNFVVPYQTYAMHHGAARERHFSPPNDLNHYDTNHAEVMIILNAATEKIDLKGTTLFINLMPCPTCARMLCQSGIKEIVYKNDHSEGYASNLLSTHGIKIRIHAEK